MELNKPHLPTIIEILAVTLPPEERAGFKKWTDEISKKDFWRMLPAFFSDDEVKQAIADCVIDQLENLEQSCGVGIHAVIKVDKKTFLHGSFNEEYGC